MVKSLRRGLSAIAAGCWLLAVGYWPEATATAAPAVLSNPVQAWPSFRFTIEGESNAVYVIEASSDLATWMAVSTNRATAATRYVEVPISGAHAFFRVVRLPELEPLFPYALAALVSVELNGNDVTVDSFDSGDPNHSTAGRYDPLKARDNGVVAVNSSLAGALAVGSAKIAGRIATGPGGILTVGPNCSVGSWAWILAGDRAGSVYRRRGPPSGGGARAFHERGGSRRRNRGWVRLLLRSRERELHAGEPRADDDEPNASHGGGGAVCHGRDWRL